MQRPARESDVRLRRATCDVEPGVGVSHQCARQGCSPAPREHRGRCRRHDRRPSLAVGPLSPRRRCRIRWGYPIEATRRKVIAWSAAPWTDVRTIDHGATRGRLVAADTTIGDITATVIGVCIPWAAAHVSTGRRDRQRWDEHLEFCASLGELLSSLSGAVVVSGDFNQTIPRRRQPQRVHDALIGALDGYDIVSSGTTPVGQLIDHIAVGSAFTATDVTTWPNVIDGARVSDHAGVAARIQQRAV
jgi:hypothetical protein